EVLYLGTPDFESYVTAQGFGYASFSLAPSAESRTKTSGWFSARKRRRRQWLHFEQGVERILVRAEQLMWERQPVLMLVDPLVSWQSVLPYRCGIPSIGVNATMASTFSPGIPPVFSPLLPAPANSVLATWRNISAWARCIGPRWWQRLVQDKILPMTLGLAPRSGAVHNVKRHGARVLWGEYGPWLDLPELVFTVRELDFPESARFRERTYVGSCVHLTRAEGHFDWDGLDRDRPLVYCSLGTYNAAYPHAKRLFTSVVDALKRREDLQGIVQVGDTMEVDAFGPLPDRIKVLKFVPQLEVLSRTNVFVTHGGPSSLREALYFGVPTIVFPCWLDQLGNAARIVYYGLGLRADIATVTVEHLLALLDEVMQKRFLENCARMQKPFREQLSCQAGVDFIEAFLRGHDGVAQIPPARPDLSPLQSRSTGG
ncbi:MAG: hypothetical protein LBR88_07305, partial [Zoogloeaceae bacterium]|nr:hypothetical protein [Zoogloeaceae bacterium]